LKWRIDRTLCDLKQWLPGNRPFALIPHPSYGNPKRRLIGIRGCITMSMSDLPDFEISDLYRDGSPEPAAVGEDKRANAPHGANPRAVALRRLIGAVLSVVGVLLVLAVFFSSPGAQAILVRTLNLPMPADQLPLGSGADVVYLERGVPWGTLRVDGVLWTLERTDQPYTGKEGIYTAIRLARGAHHIDYAASPFPSLTCVISVPAAHDDTCPLITHPGAMDVVPVLQGTRVMDLSASPERIVGRVRADLETAISATLISWTPSAGVAIGEPVLGIHGTIEHALAPLKASLTYTLVDSGSSSGTAPGTGDICASICRLDTEAYLDQATAILPILVHAHAHWTYTDAEGHVTNVADTGTPGLSLDGVITLFTRWTGFWQVTIPYFGLRNLTCDFALAELDLRLKPTPSPQHIETTGGLNAADGCLVIEQEPAKGVTTTRYFLYRFGILLATNEDAHGALPDLPLAGAPARAVARQLGAHLP
jgi:hypothetical protein